MFSQGQTTPGSHIDRDHTLRSMLTPWLFAVAMSTQRAAHRPLAVNSHGFRLHHPRMAVSGLLTGEQMPAEVLEALGVQQKRAAILFFCRDDGFECQKQLADFQERSARYVGCEVVAIRTDSRNAVKPGTEGRFPAIRFVADEGNRLRTALRMNSGGVRGGDRHTYLVDATGRVQGQINNYAQTHIAILPCVSGP